MKARTQEQLAKVLALADSNHDGEAVVAVRKARQMLLQNGLSFSDLARAASTSTTRRIAVNFPFFSIPPQNLEAEIAQLQQDLLDARSELESEREQAEFWRRRAAELEVTLNQSMGDATRWRTLARETVEKLWDLGQNLKAEEFALSSPTEETAKLTGKNRKTA